MCRKTEVADGYTDRCNIIFSACGMGWIVTLLSETVWIVLIFMFLGKMEYEKEIQKKQNKTKVIPHSRNCEVSVF